MSFAGATEWFVETIEGILRSEARARSKAAVRVGPSPIYWRPQEAGVAWENERIPLSLMCPSLGVKDGDSLWTELDFPGLIQASLRLSETSGKTPGIQVTGLRGISLEVAHPSQWPERGVLLEPTLKLGALDLSAIGPDYVMKTPHLTAVLRRQGGVIRELFVSDKVVAKEHDLYGDQEFFKPHWSGRIAASNDVESGIRIWKADDGLHLSFEGQLRGFGRFELRRPPLWYRTEYVFTDKPAFKQKWAFRSEKGFKDQTAFLAAVVQLPEADRFRFNLPKVPNLREVMEDVVGEGGVRRGQTSGGPAPERIEFLKEGKPLFSLSGLKVPEGARPNVFVHGHQFFMALLDGKGSAMDEGRWYEFEAEWQMGGQR